jgi:hypothetical protein
MRTEGGIPEITIFAGRFGSGKTEAALNYAIALSSSTAAGVILVDLDIVTPYFRSRDLMAHPPHSHLSGEHLLIEQQRTTASAQREETSQEKVPDFVRLQGVEIIAPSVIGRHLDIPAITPEILGAVEQRARPVVMDVGGDPQGARALGQYSAAVSRRGYVMHFVVNPYRPFTNTLDALARSIAEIEQAARLRVTSLVSNPNLIGETTADDLIQGHAQVEAFANELNLSVAFVCMERRWFNDTVPSGSFSQPVLILDRHFVLPWEER